MEKSKHTKAEQFTKKSGNSVSKQMSGRKEAKCDTSIFPQTVGDKTVFKEVEVTMTKDEELVSATIKKKKKKKKKAKSSELSSTKLDASTSDCDTQPPLLQFKESGVDLLNRPEISVTVTDVAVAQMAEPVIAENMGLVQPTDSCESASLKKKKKKKKKKKSICHDEVDATSSTANILEESVSVPPTYVKLPATGDTCVLVVSHENFGNGNHTLNKDGTHNISGIAAVIDQAKYNNSRSETSQSIAMKSDAEAFGCFESNPSLTTTTLINDTAGFLNSRNSISVMSNNCNRHIQTDHDLDSKDIKMEKIETLTEVYHNEGKHVSHGASITNSSKNLNATLVEGDKVMPKLSKAEIRAERRALQEAQRAAKLSKNDLTLIKAEKESAKADTGKPKEVIKEVSKSVEKGKAHRGNLFSHLPQFQSYDLLSKQLSFTDVHPAVVVVATQFSKGIIWGSNARCIALLAAFREVVKDYVTPPNKELSRDLEAKFQTYINFIANFRPLSVSMLNAIKFLKYQITHIPNDKSDDEAKKVLYCQIEKFINENVLLAKDAICSYAAAKIVSGDIILTYAYSSVVKEVLCIAFEQKTDFQVIIIDSKPKMEGQEMLRCLVKRGIQCSYASVGAISYVMKKVSKVIVGAHALLANGYVMSRVGCSLVALVASCYNVPVLVCCETYKFSERVQTDSFLYNELGDPMSLLETHQSEDGTLESAKEVSTLQFLNPLYDFTPPELVTMVVTEKGMLPCTSVPVLLRVRHACSHDQ